MAKKRKTGSRGREMTVWTSGFHVKGEKEKRDGEPETTRTKIVKDESWRKESTCHWRRKHHKGTAKCKLIENKVNVSWHYEEAFPKCRVLFYCTLFSTKMKKGPLSQPELLSSKFLWLAHRLLLQKSDKSQIFYWSSQTALGSGCRLIGWWIVNHAQKPENGPISDLFNLTQNTFCPYCLILT